VQPDIPESRVSTSVARNHDEVDVLDPDTVFDPSKLANWERDLELSDEQLAYRSIVHGVREHHDSVLNNQITHEHSTWERRLALTEGDSGVREALNTRQFTSRSDPMGAADPFYVDEVSNEELMRRNYRLPYSLTLPSRHSVASAVALATGHHDEDFMSSESRAIVQRYLGQQRADAQPSRYHNYGYYDDDQ